MEKFRLLLEGLQNGAIKPLIFLICGKFISPNTESSRCEVVLRDSLLEFENMLSKFPEITSRSTFLFVPSSEDLVSSDTFPRSQIPESVTARIRSRYPLVNFTSNPSRIEYCTQEIVIIRQDTSKYLKRNSIFPFVGSFSSNVVKTLSAQASLLPGSNAKTPVHPSFLRAISLYPIPDCVVIAEDMDPYIENHNDSVFINPGSFSKNGFCFILYRFSSRSAEISRIE